MRSPMRGRIASARPGRNGSRAAAATRLPAAAVNTAAATESDEYCPVPPPRPAATAGDARRGPGTPGAPGAARGTHGQPFHAPDGPAHGAGFQHDDPFVRHAGADR